MHLDRLLLEPRLTRPTRLVQRGEKMLEAMLSQAVLDAFFRVYGELGYGFLEAVYANAIVVELQANGITCRRQTAFEVVYRGAVVGQYRCDLIIQDRVLVEIKAIRTLTEADERQTRNYLKATKLEVGFLLNFGPQPKFRRFVYSDLQNKTDSRVGRVSRVSRV